MIFALLLLWPPHLGLPRDVKPHPGYWENNASERTPPAAVTGRTCEQSRPAGIWQFYQWIRNQ